MPIVLVVSDSGVYGWRTGQRQYLCCDGGELEGLQRLVVGGGAGVDVDHHGGVAQTGEVVLQHTGQLTVPERDHLRGPRSGEERRGRGRQCVFVLVLVSQYSCVCVCV